MAVCRVFTTAQRTRRGKRRAQWLLFILIHLDVSPRQVRCRYRRCFGIESSYRCAGRVRGWTTSNNPAYRFLRRALRKGTRRSQGAPANNPAYRFLRRALAFFLLNVWIHLRWLFTQVPRRGRRWLDTKRFELSRLAKFIRRALERLYGCVLQIAAPAVPRL